MKESEPPKPVSRAKRGHYAPRLEKAADGSPMETFRILARRLVKVSREELAEEQKKFKTNKSKSHINKS